MGEAHLILAFLLALPLLPERLRGQEIVWQWLNTQALSFGAPAAAVGDLDGDGWTDAVAFGCVPACNSLVIVSGRTGTVLRSVPPVANYWYSPMLVGTGDMDGDGTPDYALRRVHQQGVDQFVEVRSGVDDHVIWSILRPGADAFGFTMQGNVDVDGDGWPELVIGAQGENQREGAVYVFDRNGQLRYRVANNLGPFTYFGITLVSLGDVNGDGGDDFAVGYIDVQSRGTHEVYSGRTGQILSVAMGDPGEGMWQCADAAGDVDRDGAPDFVIGNLYGTVRVFSGRTGATIWRWTDPQNNWVNNFGTAVGGGVDLDRDGVPDVIVTAPNEIWPCCGSGAAYVYSGRDGTLLHHFSALHVIVNSWSIVTLPPQPGSPFGLFLLGQGRVFPGGKYVLYRGAPAGSTAFATPCAGTLPSAPKIGLRDVSGTATRVHLSDAEPGSLAVLLLGLSRTQFLGTPLPLSLDPLGFTGCSLHTSIDWVMLATAGTVSTASGYASIDLGQPTAATGGLLVHGQWIVLGSGATWPGAVSDALSWRH